MYYVYMIKNTAWKLYVGVTHNLKKRERTHNTKQGALRLPKPEKEKSKSKNGDGKRKKI